MPPRAKRKKAPALDSQYWELAQRPLHALWFLLPLMVVYEIALPIYGADALRRVSEDIYARRLLWDFFHWFGVTGYLLPGLLVVSVLVSWHFARRDPFSFRPLIYLFMAVESVLYAIPLFVFLMILARHLELAAAAPVGFAANAADAWPPLAASVNSLTWQARLVFSVGAGIYEELLFRLIGIALIHMVITDVMALPKRVGVVTAIGLSAVLFALYHFSDANPFDMGKFIQLTFAGIYLAGIYVLRGFGVVVGTHAMYDVLVVLAHTLQQER